MLPKNIMTPYKKIVDFQFPVGTAQEEIHRIFTRKVKYPDLGYLVLKKSLDARNKNKINWCYQVAYPSADERHNSVDCFDSLGISPVANNPSVAVIGAGPAGLFAALCLLKAGFRVAVFERGKAVHERLNDIKQFESNGLFTPESNYAFGEGGAGTFSDGKLTARTKGSGLEKAFVFQELIAAGAPAEIAYLTHPHVGSDLLYQIIPRLRKKIQDLGGVFHFSSRLTDLVLKRNHVTHVEINRQDRREVDMLLLATGHSAFDTYRLLLSKSMHFSNKNFALGFRVEHPQELINLAQWNQKSLPGVKAAEYRLTFKNDIPVYSFCMCPGGYVIPATAFEGQQIVNGMSFYARDGKFANAAIVAACNPATLLKEKMSPPQILDWLESIEYKSFHGTYTAPATTIHDFISGRTSQHTIGETSYPLGLFDQDYRQLLPKTVHHALQKALVHFSKQMKGFDTGHIIGLETKTSSPIQVKRDKEDYTCTFPNLFFAGEGSGFAGGIISSAIDGIKNARAMTKKFQG